MKATTTLFFALLLFTGTSFARERITEDINELPVLAQKMLSRHFASNTVSQIKIDPSHLGKNNFEVILDNGTAVDFNKKGTLREVGCEESTQVPSALILKPIREYLSANYPDSHVVSYEVKRNGYEVRLSDRTILSFNSAGLLKR